MKNIYLFFLINIVFFLSTNILYAQDLPGWVIEPKMEGYGVCVTGSAPENNNKALQKKIARINALAELSKMQEVSVSNQLDISQETTTTNGVIMESSKQISSTSRQYSNTAVNNAEDKANFYDNHTGVFYILLCIK